MDGFPAAYCRVLAVVVDGDDGVVMLDTGPREYRYLYGGAVKRLSDGWYCVAYSNGGGTFWRLTDADHDLGVVYICNEAPADADLVRVSWRGELREVPVQNGVYLAAWWREPCPDRDWPWMTACHVEGRWIGAP